MRPAGHAKERVRAHPGRLLSMTAVIPSHQVTANRRHHIRTVILEPGNAYDGNSRTTSDIRSPQRANVSRSRWTGLVSPHCSAIASSISGSAGEEGSVRSGEPRSMSRATATTVGATSR